MIRESMRMAVLTAAVFAATGLGVWAEGQKDAKAASKAEEPISVTTYDRGQITAEEGTYAENRWTKMLSEKSGVPVTWIPVPRWQAEQAYTLRIASGDTPDLIVEFDRGIVGRLIDSGAFQPVNPLIEKYSVEYKAYIAKHPELVPFLSQNGQTYAMTAARPKSTIANQIIYVRQDWLDTLKLKMPTTDEELFAVAKAFKEKDPDGNGKDDTFGMTFQAQVNMVGGWYFAFGDQWYLENGKLKRAETLDRFGDGIAFMKRMYEAGLIDPEYFTDTTYAKGKQLWVTGKAGIYLNGWTQDSLADLRKNVPAAKLSFISALTTKYGTNGLLQEPPASRYLLVGAKAKNPRGVMKFVDYMLREGDYLITNGVEGVHYKMVDGVPTTIDPALNKVQKNYNGDYPIISDEPFIPKNYLALAGKDPVDIEARTMHIAAIDALLKQPYRRDVPYVPTTELSAQVSAQFGPIVRDLVTRAIVGGPTVLVGETVAKLQSEWARLGGLEVEKEMTAWYDKNKAAFSTLK